MEPVRLLFVIDEYRNPCAGTERQLHQLVSGLDRARFAPELAVLRSSEYIESGAFPCPVRVWNIRRMASIGTFMLMRRLARQAHDEGFRVVHIFFNDAAVIVPVFFKQAGLRVISSRRDMGFWYTWPILVLLRFAARFTDAIVANSEAVAAHVASFEWIGRDKVRVIYNGFDSAAVEGSPIPDRVLAALDGRRVVGIVANIRPVKRISDLISAFRMLASRFEDCVLVVVGGGDCEPLRQQATVLGVADRVIFTGQISNVAGLIRRFDVAVLCSQSEGLSNSIIEYMAHGKPTVATRVGGNPELVAEGETGWLVPVGDVERLAERIGELLADQVLAQRFGQAGQKLVLERFDTAAMIRQHEGLYEQLLNKPLSDSASASII